MVVTETDKGVLRLQAVLDTLEDQEKSITARIDSCVREAGESLKVKNRARALVLIKKKRVLQDVLDKRMNSIHTLQQILLSIESATTNNQVLEAYSVGVDTLTRINKKHTADEAAHVMENLEEALADQKELETAMSANVTDSVYNFDEEELEKELEKLVEEDFKEKETHKVTQKEKETEKVTGTEVEKVGEKAEGNVGGQGDQQVDELAELVGGVSLEEGQEEVRPKEREREKEKVLVAVCTSSN